MVLIFLIVCPVGMIFAKAVMQNGRLDFSPAVQTLLNPENAHMIGNSLLLGVLVVLLSTLIAAPLAICSPGQSLPATVSLTFSL